MPVINGKKNGYILGDMIILDGSYIYIEDNMWLFYPPCFGKPVKVSTKHVEEKMKEFGVCQ